MKVASCYELFLVLDQAWGEVLVGTADPVSITKNYAHRQLEVGITQPVIIAEGELCLQCFVEHHRDRVLGGSLPHKNLEHVIDDRLLLLIALNGLSPFDVVLNNRE